MLRIQQLRAYGIDFDSQGWNLLREEQTAGETQPKISRTGVYLTENRRSKQEENATRRRSPV